MANWKSRSLTGVVAMLTALAAAAQSPPIRPGLWEVQSESASEGKKVAPPAERLQNLPPEARAKMEAMMKQKGIALGPGGVNRICFTKESIAAGSWQSSARCKTDYTVQTSSAWKWQSVCNEPAMRIEGVATFASPESYTVNTSTTLTASGQKRTAQTSVKAKWLGADCGDLKPFDPKR